MATIKLTAGADVAEQQLGNEEALLILPHGYDPDEEDEPAYCFLAPAPEEPASMEEALAGPDREKWLCDRADGLSLFDLTSGVSPAPPDTADSTVRSRWATRDAAARLAVRRHLPTTERAHFSQYRSAQTLYDAVVARYSSPATATLSRLFLPYLFPDLAAFPTFTDLITHLRTSDARYRTALPAEFCAKNPPPFYLTLYYVVTRLPDSLRVVRDHFLSVCPTTLTVDLLEERLLAAEQSIVVVGASRGDPRTPIFEGCSPSPLLPSVASAATADLGGFEGAGALVGGAGALVGVAGAVAVVVEAVGGLGVVVGVVVVVEVSAAAVEAVAAVAAAGVAEAGEVVEAAEADVTFDESVPYYRLFPYRTASLPPPPLFLAPGPPPVDPLPPQGPAPSGVSQVDAVEPVEVAVDSGAAPGAEPSGAGSGGAESGGAETWGAEPGGAEPGGAKPGGAEPRGAATGGTEPGGAEPGVPEPGGAEPGGAGTARVASGGASSRREVLSPRELREWFARRWSRAAGAGGTPATTGSGGTGPGGAGATGPGGAVEAAGVGPTGGSAGVSGGTGAAGSAGPAAAGATGVGAAGGVGAGGSANAGPSAGAGAGAAGAGGAPGAGAPAGSPGAVPAGSSGAPRPRPYFVPLLEQVLGLPPSPSPALTLECPQPVQPQSLLQPVSPLPAPSPYTGPTGGLAERRAPASRPASPARPACTSRRTSRPRPPAVPGTHQMALRPSTAPLRVPLPSPPVSSLPAFPDPESDSLRAASPTVARFLATVVTDPSLASTAASALVAELVDFAARCRLDYAASLVAESASVCPPSVGAALDTPGDLQREVRDRCTGCMTCSSRCFDFTYSSPQATPLSTRHSLSALPSDESVEPSGPYPQLVGCLMYLMTCTRPDLAYPLSILARYVAPGRHRPEHMAAAKRVLRYLCSTSGMWLVLGGRRPVVLTGHADASWADDQATQRSSQGYTFSLGSGSVSWRSTCSSSVLSSSCEAEIYAGAMAAQELRWLTYLLTDLGEQPRSPPVLYVDNKAMLALYREHRLEHRTKHIAFRYFLARQLQQRGQLRLAYVASEANTADIFTKALAPGDHQRFCTLLGLVPTWPHLLTS
ncbi:unnamed protein product [Closterium sp. NIES-54]